jgi:hypothetical protein
VVGNAGDSRKRRKRHARTTEPSGKSGFILDDQLAANEVIAPLQKRHKAKRLADLRPGEHVLDDRIPEILLTLNQPTFVTIVLLAEMLAARKPETSSGIPSGSLPGRSPLVNKARAVSKCPLQLVNAYVTFREQQE